VQRKHKDQEKALETPKEFRCNTRKNDSRDETEAFGQRVRGVGLAQ
jgi:hypothetical protein